MESKTCKSCREEKPLSTFYFQNGAHMARCKECFNAERSRRNSSPARMQARRTYRARNRDRLTMARKQWGDANREKLAAYMREWRKGASYVHDTHVTTRGTDRRLGWANRFFIKEAYHFARFREKVCGGKWHVDHIVPINHPLVCGLHVEHNLQVIPASENMRKSNRHWPNMWEESL